MQKEQFSFWGNFCFDVCFEKAHNRLLLAVVSVSHFPRCGLSQAGGKFWCSIWEAEVGRQIPGELTLPRKLSPENLLWVFWACEISSTFDLGHDWISSGIKVTRKNEGGPEDFLVLLWWLLPGELQCPVCWPILFIHKLVTSAFSGVHSPFPHFPTYNFLFFTYCQLLQHLTNASELCFVVKWFYCFENSNVVGLKKKKKSNVIFTVVCLCANKVRLCELGLVSVSSLPNANWAELRCCLWESGSRGKKTNQHGEEMQGLSISSDLHNWFCVSLWMSNKRWKTEDGSDFCP